MQQTAMKGNAVWKLFTGFPTRIKVFVVILGLIFAMCLTVLCVIPLTIMLIAFPKLWIIIGVAAILLIIGHFNH
jgi:hypothetical protein